MRWILLHCFILLLMSCALAGPVSAAAADAHVEPKWKEHPYLFIERSDVPRVLERARKYEWARKTLDSVRNEADKWVDRKLEFPPSTGRHDAVYICPDCKISLHTLSPTQHECPKCKKVYSGLPYDAVLYKNQHETLRAAALNLGLASLFFNDPKYARKSLDILLGYAERYSNYPLLDIRGENGRSAGHIFDQTLNEAVWIIDIAWAYDLILAAKVGTDEEHRKVEEGLLRAVAGTIKRNNAGMSNWQAWHSAGMMALALVLKDRDLVNYALNNDPGGFYYQMKNSVTSDGSWYEGSWSYHFYTVTALLRTAESAYRSGINLYKVPQMKAVFDSPLKCVMPNNLLPATHDGEPSAPDARLYELAAVRYSNPAFESVVAGSKRGGLDALISGIDEPKNTSNSLKSTIMPGVGAAVLRRGDQYLWIDYGPHGGGHGHLDKLSVNYYTAGEVFAPDLGRGWPYSLPIHQQWYTKNLSHNTVTVDGANQNQCEGKLESHSFDGNYDVVTATADQCYEGVRLKRTIAMSADWLLDIYDASSDNEHTYDWTWYTRADIATALACESSKLDGQSPSYKYLSSIRQGNGSQDWKASWKLSGGTVYGLFRGATNRQVYLCDAPDKPDTNTLHGIILRDHAKSTRFISLFSRKPMTWSDLPKQLLN